MYISISIFTIIISKKSQLQIESILRGEPSPKKRKHQIDRENRISTVFNNRDDYSLIDYLRGIAHNISL